MRSAPITSAALTPSGAPPSMAAPAAASRRARRSYATRRGVPPFLSCTAARAAATTSRCRTRSKERAPGRGRRVGPTTGLAQISTSVPKRSSLVSHRKTSVPQLPKRGLTTTGGAARSPLRRADVKRLRMRQPPPTSRRVVRSLSCAFRSASTLLTTRMPSRWSSVSTSSPGYAVERLAHVEPPDRDIVAPKQQAHVRGRQHPGGDSQFPATPRRSDRWSPAATRRCRRAPPPGSSMR